MTDQAPPEPDAKFYEWLKANPHIIDVFLKFARRARNSGHKRFGMQAIVERVRWETNVELQAVDEFKINNDFAAPMARYLVKLDPALDGLFEFRVRRWKRGNKAA